MWFSAILFGTWGLIWMLQGCCNRSILCIGEWAKKQQVKNLKPLRPIDCKGLLYFKLFKVASPRIELLLEWFSIGETFPIKKNLFFTLLRIYRDVFVVASGTSFPIFSTAFLHPIKIRTKRLMPFYFHSISFDSKDPV